MRPAYQDAHEALPRRLPAFLSFNDDSVGWIGVRLPNVSAFGGERQTERSEGGRPLERPVGQRPRRSQFAVVNHL